MDEKHMDEKHRNEKHMEQRMTMKKMERKLQRADRKHARLYLFCNFMALMIITAYVALMFSPTVQTVFPTGGDSRKQMNAIFVMTLVGCVVFTLYAAGLFFRHKSSQLGTLMALGASRKRLLPGLFREVLFLSFFSCTAGIIAGFPFVWVLWSAFRLFLVDSAEMELHFDWRCLFVSFLFLLLVVGFACLSAWRYVRRTNIMEVIREEHINEPVKELGRWCGPVGFVLILAGAVMGYAAPGVWQRVFSAYAPSWYSILYAPVFAGLYMVMLHTVVNGWGSRRKNPYKNIISRSMMKFQGKQTVNNLIIVTLLIAGACFACFYIPAVSSGAFLEYARRPVDYFYEYRADQNVPGEETVRELAGRHELTLEDWETCDYITVGVGSMMEVEEEDGRHFHVEYKPVGREMNVLSEAAYEKLTGGHVEVSPGTYYSITYKEGHPDEGVGHLNNMTTREQVEISFAGPLYCDMLAGAVGFMVVNSEDYAKLAEGLSEEWRGSLVCFNVKGADSYAFAKEFYHLFVTSFDESCAYASYYDRVVKIVSEEEGKVYWGDSDPMMKVSYEEMDSSAFKFSWRYQPRFRILDQNDFLVTMAVYFMMFLFIFIVCLTTALVVCYTRCQAIALNNRYIFDDLKKLGASPDFMGKEVRSQCSNVFKIPTIVGAGAMYLLYGMILYANDGQIVTSEIIGMGVCFGIIVLVVVLAFVLYRFTVRNMKKQLAISGK